MSFRFLAPALVALNLIAGCGDDNGNDSGGTPTSNGGTASTTISSRRDWDPDALKTAEGLAQQLRDGDLECKEYRIADFASIKTEYANKVPVPLAIASCVGPAGEDFTFEVFADETARSNFYASKLQLVCTGAQKQNLVLPGLPYVEGPTWLIEPDEEGSAKRIAEIVVGTSKLGKCRT